MESPIMNDVELMVASDSQTSRIYDYTRDRTPHYVQLKDVHNLIARINDSGGRLSDPDIVAELLVSCELEMPGYVAAVDEAASVHTAVVTISLQHMRKLNKRFPEILLVDCTHKMNSSMSMRECLEATIRFQLCKEDEYSTRVIMPTTLRDITYDDEMNQILGMTSKWLAVVFEPEYKFAVDPTSAKSDSIEDEDLIFEHL
ncbi:hypothetical protein JG688_00016528 [Phytophthora aleatoria]|uniref:ZSWIM1/3 RNaseH-like domain-containing protein n=1 Tax=Phytophthora aleatoria TaxID=2496075 RepID=A0A8J5I4A0_9STRA|nr:hypothetical protein JG688_00016528 [Phytophthora aleatoria]